MSRAEMAQGSAQNRDDSHAFANPGPEAARGGQPRAPAEPRAGHAGRVPCLRLGAAIALAVALGLGLPGAGRAAPDAPETAKGGGAPDGSRKDFRAELTLLLDSEQVRPGDVVR